MKRSGGTVNAIHAPSKRSRQDPVSCQSCRRRKLKCDRKAVCSGCSTRGLECIYDVIHTDTAAPSPTLAAHPEERTSAHATPSEPQQMPDNVQDDVPTFCNTRDDSLKTMDWLETTVMGHWVPSAVPASLRADIVQGDRADGLNIHQTKSFGENLDVIAHKHVTLRQNPADIDIASYLPPQSEALSLFRYYCDHLDYHFRAIVPHVVEEQIRTIYRQKSCQQAIDLNQIALLFSILASALHFKVRTDFQASTSAYTQAAVFLSGAALIQSNYIAYPTIEGLQATMIVEQNLSSTTLPSAVSSLFMPRLSINQAISMNLHRIDCPRFSQERSASKVDNTLLETKRRIWWSLVSNDWLLSYLNGPQEWTYSVRPDHMNVRLPLNIEDAHIEQAERGQPPSTPTAMSYNLCRAQLAIVSRQIVDERAPQLFKGIEIPYEKVIELDRLLRTSLDELPEFYRFGQAHRLRYATLYRERPAFAWQRNMLQLGYHHRICRLHRQHFIRGAKDPKYSCSHVLCLRSARTIIEIKRVMDEEEPIMEPSSSLIWAVVHHVFGAAVILLVDVCYNWEDVLAEKRKEEVIEACRMLTRAQRTSPVARRAVDAMMDVLRKHWTQERGLHCPHTTQPHTVNSSMASGPPTLPAANASVVPTPMSMCNVDARQAVSPSSLNDVPLEELWADMLDGNTHVGLDTPDWMDLLNDLNDTNIPE